MSWATTPTWILLTHRTYDANIVLYPPQTITITGSTYYDGWKRWEEKTEETFIARGLTAAAAETIADAARVNATWTQNESDEWVLTETSAHARRDNEANGWSVEKTVCETIIKYEVVPNPDRPA